MRLPHFHHSCREFTRGFRVTLEVKRDDDSTSPDFSLFFLQRDCAAILVSLVDLKLFVVVERWQR